MNKIKRLAKKKKRKKWNETETIVTETKNTEADTLKNAKKWCPIGHSKKNKSTK